MTHGGRGLVDQPGVLLGLLNLALGLVLIHGAPARTSSPSLAVARDVMPMPAWGLLFLLGGVVCLLAGHLGARGAALVGVGAGIHTFWAAALAQAALDDPRAGLTGFVVYGWVALLHITVAIRLARQVR
jgi:hypothetical protein